jgi:anti-anti-sigma factor
MENISIEVTDCPQDSRVTLLTVTGIIDTLTAPEFSRKFLSVLAGNKFKLVIDLTAVDYIGSAGWGVFISEIKHIRAQKGDLLLTGMTPEVTDVFNLLEFNTFLTAYPNVASAVLKGFRHPLSLR